jgi:hypothetical protein
MLAMQEDTSSKERRSGGRTLPGQPWRDEIPRARRSLRAKSEFGEIARPEDRAAQVHCCQALGNEFFGKGLAASVQDVDALADLLLAQLGHIPFVPFLPFVPLGVGGNGTRQPAKPAMPNVMSDARRFNRSKV